MENNQVPPRKRLFPRKIDSAHQDIRIDKGSSRHYYHPSKKPIVVGFEIIQKSTNHKHPSKRVVISIKPKPPVIQTLYVADRSRFYSKKGSDISASQLAIGDNYFINSHTNHLCNAGSESCDVGLLSQSKKRISKSEIYNSYQSSSSKSYGSTEKCIFPNHITAMNVNTDYNTKKIIQDTNKLNLIYTNTSSEESSQFTPYQKLDPLVKRLEFLENKVLQQDIVLKSLEPMLTLSSDEETKPKAEQSSSRPRQSRRTYIEQYSHVPETSAFHRYAQIAPLSPSKATTIEKEHNSEQYGRDFTAYDGITARGRRTSASVPLKRDEYPKLAADRVHKIRHKLNPVRDYRLMDTVHYLAQGEFAPRDDGIKLTPSREAVLSDIIWEDVCRTHWPNTRLSHRVQHTERHSTRCELQRLIDCLLRERVAHVERRRRRHYRIVKLNHRHENCKPLGKTGDIIVASHKNRSRDVAGSDHGTAALMLNRHRMPHGRKSHKSQERMLSAEEQPRLKNRLRQEECLPGPSHAMPASSSREPTCCYRSTKTEHTEKTALKQLKLEPRFSSNDNTLSGSSVVHSRSNQKNPRLVIKREASRRTHYSKEHANLEHYILLPTLVLRTPSNVRREKKFSELYHRILNVQSKNEKENETPGKKDISFNINVNVSEDKMKTQL